MLRNKRREKKQIELDCMQAIGHHVSDRYPKFIIRFDSPRVIDSVHRSEEHSPPSGNTIGVTPPVLNR